MLPWILNPFAIAHLDTLSGGMELLFDNVRKHTISLPAQTEGGQPAKLQDLIFYIRDKMMTEKKDLFVDGDTVYVMRERENVYGIRWLIVLFLC